jgi:hypothetical protein
MRRHFDYDRVKKQMYRIHRPHLRSHYLEKVEFHAATDAEGRPDWIMVYTPGAKARRDQQALEERGSPAQRPPERRAPPSRPAAPPLLTPLPPTPLRPEPASPPSLQAEELVRLFYQTFHPSRPAAPPTPRELSQAHDLLHRIGEPRARYLLKFAAREAPRTRYCPQTLGGILHYEAPAVAEYAHLRYQKAQARYQKARHSHEEAHQGAYQDFLRDWLRGEQNRAFSEVWAAFQAEEEKLLHFHQQRADRSARAAAFVSSFDNEPARFQRFLAFLEDHPHPGVPSFWEWDAAHNPQPFALPEPTR